MVSSKGFFRANSILESMIALTIISVCLYIAILIFAQVFSIKTSAKYYTSRSSVNELFYLFDLKSDSMVFENYNANLKIEEDFLNNSLKEITVEYTDSTKNIYRKVFYIIKE